MFKLVAWILYMTVSNVESTRAFLGCRYHYILVAWDRSRSDCQIRFSLRKLTTGNSGFYYTCSGHVLIYYMAASTPFHLSDTFKINAVLQPKSVYTKWLIHKGHRVAESHFDSISLSFPLTVVAFILYLYKVILCSILWHHQLMLFMSLQITSSQFAAANQCQCVKLLSNGHHTLILLSIKQWCLVDKNRFYGQ